LRQTERGSQIEPRAVCPRFLFAWRQVVYAKSQSDF
jgi:hypothetical protein